MSREKDLSRLVRSLRERLDLTQERLAARLDVTFASVNRWENRRATPSRLAMKQIEGLVRQMGRRGQDLLRRYFDEEDV